MDKLILRLGFMAVTQYGMVLRLRIFVGATRGKEMRNAMLFASASFAATILLIPSDLMVLMGSFVGYLALRGVSSWCLIGYVYKMANP